MDTDDTPDPSRPGSASPDSEGLRLPHRPAKSSPLVPGVQSGANGGGTKPVKRQWASYTGPDSSDEEESDTKEIITGFDAMGVQRCVLSILSLSMKLNSLLVHSYNFSYLSC